MKGEPVKIMLVDDEPAHVEAIRRALEPADPGYLVMVAATLREYRAGITLSPPDVALVDLNLPDGRSVEILTSPPEAGPFPVLIMTSYGNERVAVEALKSGALDYIVKSAESFAAMPRIVSRALREWGLLQEHRRAEMALRESEEKYRRIFQETRDVVFISTPEGRFLDINPAGVELFGYRSRDEMLRECLIQRDIFMDPEDRKDFINDMEAQGYVLNRELRGRTRSGEELVLLLTANALLDENGGIRAYSGMIRDMTRERKLELQLMQSQKMEAVGQLAGGVAHDFNNLLTAIIGYGHMLVAGLGEDESRRQLAEGIISAGEKGAAITQGLLAFSRKEITEPRPVGLNALITTMHRLLSRFIGEDIEFRLSLAAGELTVTADIVQLEQILMNLATNARDAMPRGGTLTIETRSLSMDETFTAMHGFGSPGDFAVIIVSDTGTGMDDAVRRRIFEPFFTTKETGKGTGLGLAIVYGVVRQHKGHINVYSEVGKGTTFRIYLPMADTLDAVGRNASDSVPVGGSETILVAEDNPQLQEVFRLTLEAWGYRVITARDGADAVEKFKKERDRIQLLLLDVIMPVKSGREAYEEIRELKPDIRVLFLSGYSADIIQQRGITEGECSYLSKPVSPHTLLRKIRSVLAG